MNLHTDHRDAYISNNYPDSNVTVSNADTAVPDSNVTVSNANTAVPDRNATVGNADTVIPDSNVTVSNADTAILDSNATVSIAVNVTEQDSQTVKFRKPDLSRYSVANHVEFHKLSYEICIKYWAVIDAPDLLAGYSGKVTQEEAVFKLVRRSEYTVKKSKPTVTATVSIRV